MAEVVEVSGAAAEFSQQRISPGTFISNSTLLDSNENDISRAKRYK